jgi:hypothetical protein
MNIGAPGGWGICSLKQLETNSPQSQKLPVGSIVNTYTVQAIRHTIHPTMLFTLLKVILSLIFETWQTYMNFNYLQTGEVRSSEFAVHRLYRQDGRVENFARTPGETSRHFGLAVKCFRRYQLPKMYPNRLVKQPVLKTLRLFGEALQTEESGGIALVDGNFEVACGIK